MQYNLVVKNVDEYPALREFIVATGGIIQAEFLTVKVICVELTDEQKATIEQNAMVESVTQRPQFATGAMPPPKK